MGLVAVMRIPKLFMPEAFIGLFSSLFISVDAPVGGEQGDIIQQVRSSIWNELAGMLKTISGKPAGLVTGSYWLAGILMVTVAGSSPVDILKLAGWPPGGSWLIVISGTTNQNSVSVWAWRVVQKKLKTAIAANFRQR